MLTADILTNIFLKVPYKIAPRREGDVATMFADASLANKELDWKAERGLDEMCKLGVSVTLAILDLSR